MAVEVEIKLAVRHPADTAAALARLAAGERSVYEDTYYDYPDRRLTSAGRQELRVRVIRAQDARRTRLTFKGTMLDAASTPEYETTVEDPDALHAILTRLGLEPIIAYGKHCANHTFTRQGRDVVATLVHVPEIDRSFLEIETLVADGEPSDEALATIWNVAGSLGLDREDEEPTFYIDLVTAHRHGADRQPGQPTP
jgi:adenylate cyclase, class 2